MIFRLVFAAIVEQRLASCIAGAVVSVLKWIVKGSVRHGRRPFYSDRTRRHIKLQISEQYRHRGGVHPTPGQANNFIKHSFSPGGRRATALRLFYLLRLSGVA